MEYLRIHNISIHIIFYQNRFINECNKKNFLKIPERQSNRDVFVRCRRTYVLNKRIIGQNKEHLKFFVEFKNGRKIGGNFDYKMKAKNCLGRKRRKRR